MGTYYCQAYRKIYSVIKVETLSLFYIADYEKSYGKRTVLMPILFNLILFFKYYFSDIQNV